MYQEAADIRDVYLYKKFAVQVGSWYTEGGGGRCSIDKKTKGVSAYNTQNTMENGKITSIVHFHEMEFGIMVVHDLTNDISYNANMIRPKICYFGVK